MPGQSKSKASNEHSRYARSFVDWSESEFGFYVDRSWSASRKCWELKVGPVRWPDRQRRALRHLFTLDRRGKLPYNEVWWIDIGKSAKTLLQAALAQWFAMYIELRAENILGANARDQAEARAFQALVASLEWNPRGTAIAEIYRSEVRFLHSGSVVRSIPMKAQTVAGANAPFIGIDEVWGLEGESGRTYLSELKQAPTRNVSLRFITSYPPFENDDGPLNDVLNAFFDEHERPRPGVEQFEGLEDLPLWVNPATGQVLWWNHEPYPWHHEEDATGRTFIQRERAKAEAAGMINYYLRIWEARRVSSEGTFVPERAWDACTDPDWGPLTYRDRGVPVVAAIDVGIQSDSTAIVVRSYNPATQRLELRDYRIWTPDMFGPGDRPDVVRLAKEYLMDLHRHQRVLAIGYDERHFMAAAYDLKRMGLPMVQINQMGLRTVADTQYREHIMSKRLRNYFAPDLKRHVLNAQTRLNHDGSLRMTKRQSTGHIDAAVADAMVCWLTLQPENRMRFEAYARAPRNARQEANRPRYRVRHMVNELFGG